MTWLIGLLYLVFWVNLFPLPLLDLANHSTRAYLIGHIGEFKELFNYKFNLVPQILTDLAQAFLLKIFPIHFADLLWVLLCFFSIPVCFFYYLKSLECKSNNNSSHIENFAFLSTFYIATNWFFLVGYLSYCVGISVTFLTLVLFQKVTSDKSSTNKLLCYSLFGMGVTACYLTHLSSFFFCGLIIATKLVTRIISKKISLTDVIILATPFVALACWHISVPTNSGVELNSYVYQDIIHKLLGIGGVFVRFNQTIDILLLSIWLICLLAIVIIGRKTLSKFKCSSLLTEELLVLVTLILSFFILPAEYGVNLEIDRRAVPYVCLMVISIISLLHEVWTNNKTIFIGFVLIVFNLLNLVYLQEYFPKERDYLKGYEQTLLTLPAGKTILPVTTREPVGRINTDHNFALRYIIEKKGLVPYLFSDSTSGTQFSYFNYKNYPAYAPVLDWYIKRQDIDWKSIVASYDYLIVTSPYEESRFPSQFLTLISKNEYASIYKIISKF
jgi:hypothetical protein